MPSTALEWLTALAIIGSAAFWCFRVVVWLARIYLVGKSGIDELKLLRGDHETLKASHLELSGRVTEQEQQAARHDESIEQIEQGLGLA